MSANTWTVTEARAKLSEIIERARSNGPQTITRNRRAVVVVVAAEAKHGKPKRVGSLADFFAASPLRRSQIRTKRLKDGARGVGF
jgi:prevent-host-death family protein